MYNPKVAGKVKFEISNCLKRLNKDYHRNYTVQDVADMVGCSRETISRMSTESTFALVYAVAACINELYPEVNHGEWNLNVFIELMAWDNHSFIL